MVPYFAPSTWISCLQDNFVRAKALHREEVARSWFLGSKMYRIYHGNRLASSVVVDIKPASFVGAAVLAHVHTDRNYMKLQFIEIFTRVIRYHNSTKALN